MPVFSSFFLFACFSSLALPLLNGFAGEFLILIGVFERHPAWASWASTGAVLSAIYLLWAYQRVILGDVTIEKNKTLPDASTRERIILAVLSVVILFMGVASPLFTRRMEASADNILHLMRRDRMIDVRTAPVPPQLTSVARPLAASAATISAPVECCRGDVKISSKKERQNE
jgi:NADH-quinone oxidoreductase subunit M